MFVFTGIPGTDGVNKEMGKSWDHRVIKINLYMHYLAIYLEFR